MLAAILSYLNNWFVREVERGDFSIQNGELSAAFLLPGQYFRIVGSVFNDGLHLYMGRDVLVDEQFSGQVWALAIPRELALLADEIAAWQEKNGSPGPFTAESFGGYSYTRATNAKGVAVGWQDVFAARLAPWKKPPGSWRNAQSNPHMTPPLPRKDFPWR